MTFGDKLKQARTDAGLKQSELAHIIGATNTTVSNWEKGVSKPDLDMLSYICGALNLKASYFLQPTLPDDEVSVNEFKMIKKYRALDAHGKRIVDLVLDEEVNRISEEAQKPTVIPVRLISYYYKNASAGSGQLIIDNLPEKDIEIPDIPEYKCVSYAISVNGSSMEPVYSDGDILLVEATRELHIGDIGIFLIDGQCYVKKLGETELISLNTEYPNIPLNETAQTQGKVIGKL